MMLTKADRGTFATNLSASGLPLAWDWTIAEADEFGESLSAYEDEPKGDAVVYYVCEHVPRWDPPRWTDTIQVMPQLRSQFRELAEYTYGIMRSGFATSWSLRYLLHGGAQYRKTQTDDGWTSLKSGFSVIDCAGPSISAFLSTPPEEVVDQSTKEPHQEAVEWIKEATALSWDRVGKLLGVTRQAINAWRLGGPIRNDHRQRLFEVREVLERAAKRNPRPSDLAAWLDTPRGADARSPADLLEAREIGRARLLAATTPSPKVKAPPMQVQRDALEAYQESRERLRPLPPERDEDLLAEMMNEE
jgi:hypothetical protein